MKWTSLLRNLVNFKHLKHSKYSHLAEFLEELDECLDKSTSKLDNYVAQLNQDESDEKTDSE